MIPALGAGGRGFDPRCSPWRKYYDLAFSNLEHFSSLFRPFLMPSRPQNTCMIFGHLLLPRARHGGDRARRAHLPCRDEHLPLSLRTTLYRACAAPPWAQKICELHFIISEQGHASRLEWFQHAGSAQPVCPVRHTAAVNEAGQAAQGPARFYVLFAAKRDGTRNGCAGVAQPAHGCKFERRQQCWITGCPSKGRKCTRPRITSARRARLVRSRVLRPVHAA